MNELYDMSMEEPEHILNKCVCVCFFFLGGGSYTLHGTSAKNACFRCNVLHYTPSPYTGEIEIHNTIKLTKKGEPPQAGVNCLSKACVGEGEGEWGGGGVPS